MSPKAVVSRAIALNLLLGLLATCYLAVVAPLLAEYRGNAAVIAETMELVTRFRNLDADEPGLAAQVEALRRRESAQGYTLTGATDALAAAGLQERVRTVIQRGGGTLRSIQILPAQDEGDFRRIAIRLQMMTTMPEFFEVVYALETQPPLLFLDNVDVQGRLSRQAGEKAAVDPLLVVSFDLYGYRPPGEP